MPRDDLVNRFCNVHYIAPFHVVSGIASVPNTSSNTTRTTVMSGKYIGQNSRRFFSSSRERFPPTRDQDGPLQSALLSLMPFSERIYIGLRVYHKRRKRRRLVSWHISSQTLREPFSGQAGDVRENLTLPSKVGGMTKKEKYFTSRETRQILHQPANQPGSAASDGQRRSKKKSNENTGATGLQTKRTDSVGGAPAES